MPAISPKINFSPLELNILKHLQADLPQTLTPYASIAKNAGCSEEHVLKFIQKLRDHEIIRRFGAVVKHRQLGFSHNALLAWDTRGLSSEQTNRLGKAAASHLQVSHCYLRTPLPVVCQPTICQLARLSEAISEALTDWPYQLFTMLHASSEPDFNQTKDELYQLLKAQVQDLPRPICLKSLRELKKTSMKYF